MKTRQEIIDWFCKPWQGEIRYDVEIITQFVDCMLESDYSTETVWNIILESHYGCLWEERYAGLKLKDPAWFPPKVMCWMTREGKTYTCKWAGHARMLRYIGMREEDAEALGWLKVTQTGEYCMFKRSRAQIDKLRRMGIETDKEAERIKPHYV